MSDDSKVAEARQQFLIAFAEQRKAVAEDLQKDQLAITEKMTRHLVGTTDSTLLLLKAYLLVEEQMNWVIVGLLPRSDALKGGRFSFDQKNRLLQAFDYLNAYADLFRFVQRLNRIRNKMAHELEPPDLSETMLQLADEVLTRFGDKFPSEQIDWKVGTCVALLSGQLASFLSSTKVLRDFVAGYNAGRLGVLNAGASGAARQ